MDGLVAKPPLAFLSTLPVRGATIYSRFVRMELYQFLSTLPVRGATFEFFLADQRAEKISIHAPREGSDYLLDLLSRITDISIHAPREGSDKVRMAVLLFRQNFYPRSP